MLRIADDIVLLITSDEHLQTIVIEIDQQD